MPRKDEFLIVNWIVRAESTYELLKTTKDFIWQSREETALWMKIYFALFIIGTGSKYFYVDQNEVYSNNPEDLMQKSFIKILDLRSKGIQRSFQKFLIEFSENKLN